MKTQRNPQYLVQKTETEWKAILSPEAYHVLRKKGTEPPGTGQYNHFFEKGHYRCKACGEILFDSESKFDIHCGWSSFDKEIKSKKILKQIDTSHGIDRTEILCDYCGSHLGHLFNDGPTETGLRYCVNSLSLDFEYDEKKSPFI
ncbi:MAG: peptide-methionine (R)-S-oxide reductase MsrB [Flavobacteriales bacterium AspAUS03]